MHLRYKAKNSEEYSLIHKMCSYKTSTKCGVSLNNNVSNAHQRDFTFHVKLLLLLAFYVLMTIDDKRKLQCVVVYVLMFLLMLRCGA